MRAYTPISNDDDLGFFELVVKIYRRQVMGDDYSTKALVLTDSNEGDADPGGKMSQYLESLQVGDTIDVKGPLGHVNYEGPGQLRLSGELHQVNNFVTLCGGTGITPMYQLIKVRYLMTTIGSLLTLF